MLVVEQRWITEIDINPLLASPERLIALDARVVLHDPDVQEADLPRLAIRPYPRQYVAPWTAARRHDVPDPADPARGRAAAGRVPRRADRGDRLLALLRASWASSERTAHERLIRVCFNDYDREIALVAEETDATGSAGSSASVGCRRTHAAARRPSSRSWSAIAGSAAGSAPSCCGGSSGSVGTRASS